MSEQGYYETPNIYINHNNRPKGQVAEIALEQLAPFVRAAKGWSLREVNRDNRHGMACSLCNQMIFFISDVNGVLFAYSEDDIQALVTAHIRQLHESVVLHGTV
jgi:hypothetical protein